VTNVCQIAGPSMNEMKNPNFILY